MNREVRSGSYVCKHGTSLDEPHAMSCANSEDMPSVENPWRPIKEYLALRRKPEFAAFSYGAHNMGRYSLSPVVRLEYPFGVRNCNGWMPLPEPVP